MTIMTTGGGGVLSYMDGIGQPDKVLRSDGTSSTTSGVDVNDENEETSGMSVMRLFESGATRHSDTDKIDPEGFLSPLVIAAYSGYMHRHRVQADGQLREADNWQKGIPRSAWMKSAWRHFLAWWSWHRGYPSHEPLEDALCGLLFNVQGYLHEVLKHVLKA